MEDKLLNIMEKMYNEINDMKTIMATKQDITNMKTIMATKQDITNMKTIMATKQDITKIEIKIENEVVDKVRALYDNREIQSETNEKILNTINRLETKIDVLQKETAHVRRVK